MSAFAVKVSNYYESGLWVISRVQKASELLKITQAEFNEIVGDMSVS